MKENNQPPITQEFYNSAMRDYRLSDLPFYVVDGSGTKHNVISMTVSNARIEFEIDSDIINHLLEMNSKLADTNNKLVDQYLRQLEDFDRHVLELALENPDGLYAKARIKDSLIKRRNCDDPK